MDLYLVVSEQLTERVYIERPWLYYREPYRICELVIAESHSQARWLAWKSDRSPFTSDIRDMPKFAIRKKTAQVKGEARIVTKEKSYRHAAVWGLGNAPHIGIKGGRG